MYQYNAHVEEVIDGDTFKLRADLGFNINIYITARLLEIDTPEKFVSHKKGENEKELGLICKAIVKACFENADVVIETQKPDSFGRVLCHMYYPSEDGKTYYNVVDLYNRLGINKLSNTYDPNRILTYKEDIPSKELNDD